MGGDKHDLVLASQPIIGVDMSIIMPTTRVERTIQSVISLKHRWRNPLDRMKSSAVGLHPLPIELWEEIFAIATDADIYWAERDGYWCTIWNPFFSKKEEDHLRDPMACDNQALFRTRHSIILVCKSWYFLGIPILWSHLQFNEQDPLNIATMIYSALKRNPTLASHVLRVTIKSPNSRQNNSIKIHAVEKFIRLLTNIEAISCPLPYAAHLYGIQPGIVMLSNQGMARYRSSSDDRAFIHPLLHDSFWIHCRTLSLTLQWRPFADIIRYQHGIRFDNLVNLRLDVDDTALSEWIGERWVFPLLKNLRIIVTDEVDYTEMLTNTRMTVKRLHIHVNSPIFWWACGRINMSNLNELHVSLGKGWDRRSKQSFTSLKAPSLHRYIISWDPYLEAMQFSRKMMLALMALTFSYYPLLQELVIIVPMGKWVRSSGDNRHVLLLLEDIARWCEHVTVEIMTGKHLERIIYAKGSSPMDELDALEGFGMIRPSGDVRTVFPWN
jgi:hypothetical protein